MDTTKLQLHAEQLSPEQPEGKENGSATTKDIKRKPLSWVGGADMSQAGPPPPLNDPQQEGMSHLGFLLKEEGVPAHIEGPSPGNLYWEGSPLNWV